MTFMTPAMQRTLFVVAMLGVALSASAAEKPLTRADILRENAQRFARADLNHDGVLSAEERRLAQPAASAGLPLQYPLPGSAAVSITRLRTTGPLQWRF
jgi:hypothetical protein